MEGPGIVFTFGRFNPMHQGHYTLSQHLQQYAAKHKMDAVLYTSFSQNAKKNPLSPTDKVMYLTKMVPKGVRVSNDQTLKNSYQILEDLIRNKKYTKITFLVDESRVNDFQAMKKYANKWASEEQVMVNFKIEQHQNNKEFSGIKMRQFVKDNNFKSFRESLPLTLRTSAMELFNKTKFGLGL